MNRNQKIIFAFAAGAAIGGTIALLFAPEKGSETRQQITDKGGKVKAKLMDIINEILPACNSDKDQNTKAV